MVGALDERRAGGTASGRGDATTWWSSAVGVHGRCGGSLHDGVGYLRRSAAGVHERGGGSWGGGATQPSWARRGVAGDRGNATTFGPGIARVERKTATIRGKHVYGRYTWRCKVKPARGGASMARRRAGTARGSCSGASDTIAHGDTSGAR